MATVNCPSNVDRAKRVMAGGCCLGLPFQTARPATSSATSAVNERGSSHRRTHSARVIAGVVSPASAPGVTSSSTYATVAASVTRRVRSLSRHRWMRVRIREGTDGGSAFQSGWFFNTFANVSDMVSPSKARFPVSISKSTHPNAQVSARLSTGLPRACSGDMYAAVPSMTPGCVACGNRAADIVALLLDADGGSSALAKPKSRTFTTPSGRSLMLAGFRSR